MEVFSINNIGFMQGRLTKALDKKLQFFPWDNWLNEFSIAKNNDFNNIEWTIDTYNIQNNPFFFEKKKVLENLKHSKLNISAITCDFIMEQPFYKNNTNEIDSLDFLKRTIDSCEFFGVKYIVVPLVDNGSIKEHTHDLLFLKLQNVSDMLSKNINILFETDFSPSENLNFIKSFDNNKFGLNYDTGNSAHLGFPFLEEIIFFKFVKNIHIKDRILNSISVPLGKGDFNFRGFYNFLKNYKYTGIFTLQTARSPYDNDLKNLLLNRDFLINLNEDKF